LARAGDDGTIGRAGGGVAFSLRNLFRVGDRFRRYSGGELPDAALMRRETEEVYAGGLFTPEDIQTAKDILDVAMPYAGKGFYDELKFENTKADFTIGDVTVPKLATGHALVPDENSILEMTPRTKQTLYRLAKALDNGENVALIGERASGKTAVAKMYAHLVGQPYHRQMISASTDASALIGGYDNLGWKDGPLLTASRPTGTPGMLLVDEMNFGSSAVLERLNSVLDDERKVVLSEKEGEEFQLHPDFRFVGAMNPPTNKYGGRNKLSVALQNRLTQIYVPELKEAPELQQILRARAVKKGLPEVISDRLLDLHQWAIESYGNGTLGKELRESDRPIFSIRQLTKALDMTAEFQKDLGPGEAFLLAIQTYYAASPQANDAAAIVAKARELAK
jgi:midasin (ATPase involved in ribosome maturation)